MVDYIAGGSAPKRSGSGAPWPVTGHDCKEENNEGWELG